MKLVEIQSRLGCSLLMAKSIQDIIAEEQATNQAARILCRSALAELNNAIACGNAAHSRLDAAADYLRDAIELAVGAL